MVGTTQGIVTDTVFDDRKVSSMYVALQAAPFNILIIHFLYRYWSVRRPHLISLFSSKTFIAFLIFATAAVVCTWYTCVQYGTTGEEDSIGRREVIAEYERMYGKRIENAWLVYDHWSDGKLNVPLFTIVVTMNILASIMLTLALSLAFFTIYHIYHSPKMSTQAVTLQKKLLIALCAQAAVPGMAAVPGLCTINVGFFQLDPSIVLDSTGPLTAIFPVCDAAIMILLLTDYRRGLVNMIMRRTKTTATITSTSGIVSTVLMSDVSHIQNPQ